jgi:hypothetical protein
MKKVYCNMLTFVFFEVLLVVRDFFYIPNVSYYRFGSFEIFKPLSAETGRKGPSVGNEELLRQMLDYAIKTFYTEVGYFIISHEQMKYYVEI